VTFDDAWAHARDVEGWLTEAQARRLFAAATRPGAGGDAVRVVEIGSFRGRSAIVLAAGALIFLGAAMTLLAVAYLTVQYMVALGETRFLWVLGVIAVAEPILLSATSLSVTGFAGIVFAVQCVVAGSVLVLGLRARRVRAAAGA